jgi:hypothetical protein
MPNRPGAPYRRQVATRPQSVRYGPDPVRRGRIADAAVTRRAGGAAPDGKPPALFPHSLDTRRLSQERSRGVDDHDDRSASGAGERRAIAIA